MVKLGNLALDGSKFRAMIRRQGRLWVGLGGHLGDNAQVWKLTESGWVKHLLFKQKMVAVLQTDDRGRLFIWPREV